MLIVHRAERADGLVAALAGLLAEPPADPFAPEVVAVPTRGMERWLAQRMSGRLGAAPGRDDGVCANVEFPSPRAVAAGAVAAASGVEPDADPWAPERCVWPLIDVADAALEEPWLSPLARHLGAAERDEEARAARRDRRFSALRHMADLYDRYGLHRPDMIRAWAAGADVHATGAPLPEAARWQAELWRRLRAAMPLPSPAERVRAACERLRDEPGVAALPARLSVFGLTRLPAGRLEVLEALAEHRAVHLFLLHPSPELWRRVAAVAGSDRVVRRREDPTRELAANPLLASWGQDARELQLVAGGGAEDRHHAVEHAAGTLLARIQADVREDRPAPGVPLPGQADQRAPLDPADRSLEVHACHGRARQVEVVRDAILHRLAQDPTLEPRDVIVMCPDIEAFAPLIQATFGAGEAAAADAGEDGEGDGPHGDEPAPAAPRPPDLRVRLADRSLRQTNPVLGVVASLLELAAQRVTASQVLDLADREPVRRRFGFDDDELTRVRDWVAASGIRWGLDAGHRAPFKLAALGAGTWRAGLDRILVGATMTDDPPRLVGGVLALDDVESGAIDLAGRLAELVDRLDGALAALRGPQAVDGWARALAGAADALTLTAPADAWQRTELERLLDDVVSEARDDDHLAAAELSLAEVRSLLAERLQGRPTRANFRTGHLTICTLVPMRSVPHRVVCLLGLDDGVFPRRAPRDGDDLMLHDPHVGDRDPRTEDRQLLLDALMAASDSVIVAYTGRDERTNAERPPAVPVGELLDVVDRTARLPDGPARAQVVVEHPLQPFDPRNYTAGALVPDRAWSFDRVTLRGARALGEPAGAPRPFLLGPLPAAPAPLVEVEELVRFVAHPVRAFLRRRLGIGVGDFADEVQDALPVELDGLERWTIGDRLLAARLAGADRAAAVAAEKARGDLPPGVLADRVVAEIMPVVEDVADHARAVLPAGTDAVSIDVRVVLPGGRVLSGTVPGVQGDVLRTVTYSRVNPRHRLEAWVRLLALTAAHPDRPFSAVTVGRARYGAGPRADVTVARIAPLADHAPDRRAAALERLAVLVDLFDRGMREPPPLAVKTSAAYAAAADGGRAPAAAARSAWESTFTMDNEDKDLEHQLVHGGVLALEDLLAAPPGEDEAGPGWDAADPSRFGRYARRLWDPLLAAEELSDR
jgi:exodeoxyribonuclease V gamma subunit